MNHHVSICNIWAQSQYRRLELSGKTMCHVALWIVHTFHFFKLVAGAFATSLQNFDYTLVAKVKDWKAPTPMALDNLKYGNFRPTTVVPEARSLPGYGGQVEEWANYKFQVQAIEMKESQMSEGERKKLGGLALRLTERLHADRKDLGDRGVG